MASTSSSEPRIVQPPSTVRKINDALYELYRPATGSIEIEIIFFHGLRAGDYSKAYLETWMLADDSQCWLNSLLTQDFPQARILSVTYDSSTQISNCTGRMDMHNVGENLAQSLIMLAGIGQSCPVVLVGHCIGGLVLKQLCVEAEQKGAMDMGPGTIPYKTFLRNMKLAFFYSTPNLGSRVILTSKQRGPLLQYLEMLNKDAARLNSRFAKLRQQQQHGWKTCGVGETDETEACRSNIQMLHLTSRFFNSQPQYLQEVEEGSARYDMDDIFFLSGEDNTSICKPKDRNSSSYQYLVQVVQEVLQVEESLKAHWRKTLRMPPKLVDTYCRVEQVIHRLGLSSRLALVGMGGVGKTTLAKAVLSEIRENFDFVCFVEDVKRKLKLQSENLHDLIAENLYVGTGRKVHLPDGAEQSLWLYLRRKKVLLIMDDVDSEDQINSLLEDDWLGEESRVIITSRIQSKADMSKFQMYEVPFLCQEESEDLFRSALDVDVISIVPEDLIQRMVRMCDGLPLTVEVISKYLKLHKNVGIWESTFNKLTEAESLDGSKDDRLWAKLKVSFDDLAKLEQNMFLDIAVFDEKMDLETWEAAWETGVDGSSVASGWTNLIDRSLISLVTGDRESVTRVSSSNTMLFRMHQQLRDLGKNISRPPYDKIELCRASWRQRDVTELLNIYKGDKAQTQIVSASFDRIEAPLTLRRSCRWSSIAGLHELRLLRLSNVNMSISGNGSRFPFKLRVLHLSCCFKDPHNLLQRPSDFFRSKCWPIREQDVEEGLQQLSVLILDKSTVRFPWNFHKLTNLKVLIVRGSRLKDLPERFGRLPALRKLILQDVPGLSQLPNSFSQLSSLRTLTLQGGPLTVRGLTPQLARWEEKAPRPLHALTELSLVDLHQLTELPGAFGLFECLESVIIVRCPLLKELPEDFAKLSNLRELRISDCHGLESLSESLGELGSLRTLLISGCLRLLCLPDSLGHLQSLHTLGLLGSERSVSEVSSTNGLRYLQRLPDTLGQLKSLKTLEIGYFEGLETLPDTLGQLSTLHDLVLFKCVRLRILPESLGQLKTLRSLHLRWCSRLESLPHSLAELKSLVIQTNGCSTQFEESLQKLWRFV